MPSVKFDNIEIVTTTYIPKIVQHESAPLRELMLLGRIDKDGDILISERYGQKIITIAGNIMASNQDNLEIAIDVFKELFSRKEKNLDISWAGGTRRYVATVKSHSFDRQHMHIGFCPWSAEFVVPEGIGKATSAIAAINALSVNATPYSSTVTMSTGSAVPQPIITITIGAGFSATCLGISFENTDRDEKIIVNSSSGFSNGDVLVINCDTRIVQLNSENVAFHGVFPTFPLGSSNFKIETGKIADQQFVADSPTWSNALGITNLLYRAQSFIVPEKDVTYQGAAFFGRRDSSPGNLTFRIETDNGGLPSGVLAHANATATVAEGTISTSFEWQDIAFGSVFELEANTKYWFVMQAPNGDGSNSLNAVYDDGTAATYKRGHAATSIDSGANWTTIPTYDFRFKIQYGGLEDTTPDLTFDVDYTPRYL